MDGIPGRQPNGKIKPEEEEMDRMLRASLVLVAFSAAAPGTANADPLQHCQAEKIRAAASRTACLAADRVRVLHGHPSDRSSCLSKFRQAISRVGTCRFLDNGDGTVSDLDTGLMWEQGVSGPGTCLYCVVSARSWPEAMGDWVSQVNGPIIDTGSNEQGLGGYSDWRIPTVEELRSLLDPSQPLCGDGGACSDPIFAGNDGRFWTASTSNADPTAAEAVFFDDGSDGFQPKGDLLMVRAVRGFDPAIP
jgi:uncharacterized protein DUF1566